MQQEKKLSGFLDSKWNCEAARNQWEEANKLVRINLKISWEWGNLRGISQSTVCIKRNSISVFQKLVVVGKYTSLLRKYTTVGKKSGVCFLFVFCFGWLGFFGLGGGVLLFLVGWLVWFFGVFLFFWFPPKCKMQIDLQGILCGA